jgi:lysophospholipase L1-like esterase
MKRQRQLAPGRRPSLRAASSPVLVLLAATALAPGVGVGPAVAKSAHVWASATVASAAATLGVARRPAATPHGGTTAATAAGAYRVVGLGDSVPSGNNCGCVDYVTLVTRAMAAEEGKAPAVHNEAQGGLTTADVLAQLAQPQIRTEIADSDLVIMTVGANDFDTDVLTSASCQPDPATTCYAPTLAQQRTQLDSILNQVRTLQAARGGRAVVTGYWNVFLDGDVAAARGPLYVQDSDELTEAENAQIASLATQAGSQYVDVYAPFKAVGNDTPLLAADGDHPSAAGHTLIADALANALH